MKILTSKEWYEGLMLAESFSDKKEYIWGFSAGMQYVIDKLAPKVHVAEVVKCGDVNKPKSNDHPQEWFDAQQKELKRHYQEDFAEGMLSGSRKNIEDMVTKCDHEFTILYDTGYTCMKCGEWVNIYDL